MNEQIETVKLGGARSQSRETRTFVNERLRDLRKLLNDEAKIARAAISKHVQKITLTQEGRSYVVSRDWDLLGLENVAIRTVPGAGLEHNRPSVHFRFKIETGSRPRIRSQAKAASRKHDGAVEIVS